MKNQLIFTALFAIITVTLNAQKKIIGAPIEGTNLFISAEAYTVSNVEFKIKKNVTETITSIPDFTLNPLTQYSFKVKLTKILENLSELSSQEREGVVIDSSFSKLLINSSERNINKEEYYRDKAIVNERINYLYNYFNSQLILIFKYDNEPIAGRLQYDTEIKRIQYFPNDSYETYFNNKTRNYHRLIRELYQFRYKKLDTVETKGNKEGKDQNARIIELEREIDKIIKPNTPIENYVRKRCSTKIAVLVKENSLLLENYRQAISKHFNKHSKEYRTEYINDPDAFLCQYIDIVNNFRNYNRNKRMELIKEQLLQHRNEEIYREMKDPIDTYKNETIELTRQKEISEIYSRIEKLLIKREYYEKQIILLEKDDFKLTQNLKRLKDNIKSFNDVKENLILNFRFFSKENNLPDDEKYSIDKVSIKALEKYSDLKSTKIDYDEINKKIINSEEQFEKLKKNKLSDKVLLLSDSINYNNNDIDILKTTLIGRYKIILSEEDFSLPIMKKKLADLEKGIDRIYKKIGQSENKILIDLEKVPLWEFKALDIQLDINDGFVEHIVALGTITVPTTDGYYFENFNPVIKQVIKDNPERFINGGKELKFVSQFPYGFSSSKDFDDFKQYKLHVYDGKHKQFEMKLEYLFPNYVQTLQNDRLDFSPKNQVVNLPVDSDTEGSVELKKDKSSKLFSLSAYSDFNGLKETEPNGVIQFEVNKLIPLYTKRRTSLFGERYINRGFNYGYLNYINPQFRWSRLSDNNDEKNLTLSYLPVFNGATIDSLSYVTQLDLLRHENISVGADLNIFSFDLPTSKMRIEVNASGRYARTRVLDTRGRPVNGQNTSNETVSNVVQTFNLNTWRFYPEFILRLRPEERYGANLALRPIRFNTVTDGFSNISSEEEFTTTLMNNNKQWLHQVEINAHFSPSGKKDDRFFFRYRYTNTSTWEYNGFSEIQIGYSMSLKF